MKNKPNQTKTKENPADNFCLLYDTGYVFYALCTRQGFQ